MKAIALFAVLLGLLAVHRPAQAQVYPCSGQPGEVMVGEQPAGNGVAAIPLCQQSQQAAAPAPAFGSGFIGPAIGMYGAIVVDDADHTYASVWGQDGKKAAKNYAMQTCEGRGGKACRVITTFTGHASLVVDRDNQFFAGANEISRRKAILEAFDNCNKKSRSGGCTLLAPPVMSGIIQEPDFLTSGEVSDLLYGQNNRQPGQLDWQETQRLGKDLAALSVYMDTRTYWGATAADADGFFSAYNQPDQHTAEAEALKGCATKDCKVAQVFKNTCAGIAWPKDKSHGLLLETAEDPDPAAAKAHALAQCTDKHGDCKVQARCSGRIYAKADPDAPDSQAQPKDPNQP